nr:phosphatase PAP2 family protein [Gordonia otitidis]
MSLSLHEVAVVRLTSSVVRSRHRSSCHAAAPPRRSQAADYARNVWVRILGAIYPSMIAFVVIGTANHYVLDVAAIAAVIAVAMLIVHLPWSRVWHRAADRSPSTVARCVDDRVGTGVTPQLRGDSTLFDEERSPDRFHTG